MSRRGRVRVGARDEALAKRLGLRADARQEALFERRVAAGAAWVTEHDEAVRVVVESFPHMSRSDVERALSDDEYALGLRLSLGGDVRRLYSAAVGVVVRQRTQQARVLGQDAEGLPADVAAALAKRRAGAAS